MSWTRGCAKPLLPPRLACCRSLRSTPRHCSRWNYLWKRTDEKIAMADAKDLTKTNDTRAVQETQHALAADGEELAALLHSDDEEVLLALLKTPALAETDVTVLLARKNLPTAVIEKICQRRDWLKTYALKKALACHPHTPRLVSLRLLKEMYLMDLGQIALLPGVSAELKRNAEDQLATRLPQLPLGQKITLARRGPARVAGLLLAEGHALVVPVALDNSHLTAAQILKGLAREGVPESVVQAIALHRKWSCDYNVRLALIRNPATTLAVSLAFLLELTVSDLNELSAPGIVPEPLRQYLQAETQRRIRAQEKLAPDQETFDDDH